MALAGRPRVVPVVPVVAWEEVRRRPTVVPLRPPCMGMSSQLKSTAGLGGTASTEHPTAAASNARLVGGGLTAWVHVHAYIDG